MQVVYSREDPGKTQVGERGSEPEDGQQLRREGNQGSEAELYPRLD